MHRGNPSSQHNIHLISTKVEHWCPLCSLTRSPRRRWLTTEPGLIPSKAGAPATEQRLKNNRCPHNFRESDAGCSLSSHFCVCVCVSFLSRPESSYNFGEYDCLSRLLPPHMESFFSLSFAAVLRGLRRVGRIFPGA